MKAAMNAALFVLLAGFCPASAIDGTPMERVVSLVKDLKKKVIADGKDEQSSFDEYACWCEKTLERKASDITSSKELIQETEILISKLKGEIASHGAEIAQLNKDIAKNIEGQREATEVRDKEYGEYHDEKSESEQCIGAMEAAIRVLTGSGTKKGFLDTSTHAAQLLSVAASIRSVFSTKSMPHSVSDKDLDMVKSFVANPENFMKAERKAMSAAQVGQNPFGDYAPQSTQIQGILKGMYDAFTADLEKDNVDEAETQKSFEELMATKKQEFNTLETTLKQQETDHAAKTKRLAESETLLDDSTDDMNNDEAFFEDTKAACQQKAKEWSVRTRLRTEELNGMHEAIKILSSDDAKKTFASSTTTFLQLASVRKHAAGNAGRNQAYDQLKTLASKFHSRSVAKIAVAVQSGGHFDKVITMIDDMVALLRKEEQSDIDHRDRCENDQNANKNEMADLEASIKKTGASINRMKRTEKDLQGDVVELEKEIAATQKDMAELLKMRNGEVAAFRKALQDDTDAVALLQKAIVALSKFYKRNKINLPELVQKKDPEYTKDEDKAPEASFSGDYGGRSSESGGILAILEMLVEDSTKEIAEGRADDADAEEKYNKQESALSDTLASQEDTKTNTETQLADLQEKIRSYKKFKNDKNGDLGAEEDTKKSVATDCDWVKSHFDTRRQKRKTEIQGLVDAKAFLAGVAAGDDPLPL